MTTVVTFTAWNRPDYLSRSLHSWRKVHGIAGAHLMFRVEPGSPEVEQICRDATFGAALTVTVNPERYGESRNPWEALNDAFTKTDADFVILAEDDDMVSDDILEYFSWASQRFRSYRSVFAVCAFQQEARGGDHEALMQPFFQPWIWGIWRDRWEAADGLRDDWDFTYAHKGFDWHIREGHVQLAGRTCVFPARSRVQIIGEQGVHFTPEVYPDYVSKCFEPSYQAGRFTLAGRGEPAMDMMNKGAPRDPAEVEERLWEDAKGAVGFDVGSNMGQSVGRMVGQFNLVIAYEPADESFQVLNQEWGQAPNVRCVQMALTDHTGELTTAVRLAPIQTGQLTAIDMPYRGEHSDAPGMANWGIEYARREVPCSTLDDQVEQLALKPDFIKIDTEGHEYQVLLGAQNTLREDKPRLLVEFHTADLHDKCVSLLESLGYVVETVRHPHYPPGTYMYDQHGWLRAAVIPQGEAT